MILADNIKKSNILIKPKSKNRWELIDEMVNIALKNNEIPAEHIDSIRKSLIEREKSMSTGIGNNVAIPHCTSSKITDIIIIMTINKNGIDFDSIDNQPVKIAILLLVPKNKLTQHIKTLANIARMMSDTGLREKLLTIKTPEGVIKTLKNYKDQKK